MLTLDTPAGPLRASRWHRIRQEAIKSFMLACARAYSSGIGMCDRPHHCIPALRVCVCMCACTCVYVHVCMYVCVYAWLGQPIVSANGTVAWRLKRKTRSSKRQPLSTSLHPIYSPKSPAQAKITSKSTCSVTTGDVKKMPLVAGVSWPAEKRC